MRQRIQHLRSQKADGGFTLVELLIVIVVLGILAGIVVFGVSNFRDQAEVAVCKADVKTVQVAVDAFNAATDGFPADEAALVTAQYLKTDPETDVAINQVTGEVTPVNACA
jgi:type II secretion system protein G